MIETRNSNYWKNEILSYDNDVLNALKFSDSRVKLSEEILNGIRNFCESVACFIFKSFRPDKKYEKRYQEIEEALNYCNSISKFNFISKFHEYLNASTGHKRFHGEYAERLTLKYIDYLLKIKEMLKNEFHLEIFKDLSSYPFDMDDSFKNYYIKISELLSQNDLLVQNDNSDIYYIYKKKLIYINKKRFYEYTISNAIDKNNRNDRFLTFSLYDIPANYAVNLAIITKPLDYLGISIDCSIITKFEISIRPCEIEKICEILAIKINKYSKSSDYWKLMDFLKTYNTNIAEIIKSDEDKFQSVYYYLFQNKKSILSLIFLQTREKYLKKVTGINTLLYLLYRTRNVVLKNQLPFNSEDSLSTMNLSKKTYAFEKAPFSSGLVNHVPKTYDLINLFDFDKHKSEYIARKISEFSNESGCIYIDSSCIDYPNLEELVNSYNIQYDTESLKIRKILQYGKNYYLNSNEINTINIIEKVREYSKKVNFIDYEKYAIEIIDKKQLKFDDQDKETALKKLFASGSIFAVYGSAGTGKSFFANLVLKILDGITKICIAVTNTAVDNMRRKFDDNTAKYMTIEKYLNEYQNSIVDLLIIDECSTVSSEQMSNILSNTKPKLLLLLGDYFQIQAIKFGNWFALIHDFINKNYYVDLKCQFRTDSETLKPLWDEVRNLSSSNTIIEKLSTYEISHRFDSSVFYKNYDDEVILCLNYDGLYGINNFNKVLQKNNPNKEFKYKQYIFKVNDPIIFDDTNKFRGLFYNNLKGIIIDIEENLSNFKFTVRVTTTLNSIICERFNVNFIKYVDGDTIVSFYVDKVSSEAYDGDTDNITYFPFQVAYAMSIHKAQGLEFDSVKVIISNEVEDNITHNVFYTAITRARKNLTIYWTQETEKKIINAFKIKNYKKDASILKSKFKELKFNNMD